MSPSCHRVDTLLAACRTPTFLLPLPLSLPLPSTYLPPPLPRLVPFPILSLSLSLSLPFNLLRHSFPFSNHPLVLEIATSAGIAYGMSSILLTPSIYKPLSPSMKYPQELRTCTPFNC